MPSRSSMVRVTLTNHRRLCLFPTDYDIRHTVVTVNLAHRTRFTARFRGSCDTASIACHTYSDSYSKVVRSLIEHARCPTRDPLSLIAFKDHISITCGSISMAERSYTEQRDSASKFTRLLLFFLLGFVILLVGIGLVNWGLTAQSCSGGFFSFGETCVSTTNYSLLGIGIVFVVFSSPIFLLSWNAYKQPERMTIIKEIQQPIMVRCSHCNSTFPKGTSNCYHCGANL